MIKATKSNFMIPLIALVCMLLGSAFGSPQELSEKRKPDSYCHDNYGRDGSIQWVLELYRSDGWDKEKAGKLAVVIDDSCAKGEEDVTEFDPNWENQWGFPFLVLNGQEDPSRFDCVTRAMDCLKADEEFSKGLLYPECPEVNV